MDAGLGVHGEADCQVVTELDFRLLGLRASYVSLDGLFLETREAVSVGDHVIVSLKAPGTGEWLDAEAQVARVVPLDDAAGVRGVGLRFSRMDAESRRVLDGALGPRRADLDSQFASARRS